MSTQQDSCPTEALAIRPHPIAVLAATGLAWVADRPAYLKVATAITLLFGLLVAAISQIIGTPLNLPDERVSLVLGINVVVPLGLAITCYLVTQGILILRGKAKRSHRQILGDMANDLILVGLYVGANYLHFNLKMWVPLINPALFDAAYMASDESLRPLVDAFAWASTTIRTNLNPEFRWYQFLFLTMFVLTFCRFAAVRNALYPRFAVSMLLMVTLGALSYLIAPALGPFIYEDGNTLAATEAQAGMYAAYQSVQAEGAAWIARNGSDYFTGALAAMPSLHVGYASLMTYYMLKNRDYLAPLFVLFWLWILIDSVALRWHYAIDAPAGIALAALVIWLTNRLLARRPDPQAGRSGGRPLPATDPTPGA
jgi:hypothetical protein